MSQAELSQRALEMKGADKASTLADPGIVRVLPVRVLPDGRMTRADAARYLGVQPQTLRNWACQGKGPRVTKVGGRCFYFKTDLDAFIASDAPPES